MSTSLLADMINNLKVSSSLRLINVIVPNNKIIKFVLKLLVDLGYIRGFCIINFKNLKLQLMYKNGKPNIRQFFMISKPSSKLYSRLKYLKGNYFNNYISSVNFLFFSTSRGFLTDLECKFTCTGGELIAAIN